ncbi:MAG: DUF4398 domain-containing protein [Candidatus Bilamarchaeaceae archaeon]
MVSSHAFFRSVLFILAALSVLSFGVPTDLSIEINNGAPSTNSTAVILTLGANDAVNCSLSNDATNYCEPFPFTSTKDWNLSTGDGLKMVYFKCADIDGNWSDPVNDTIILNTTQPDSIPPSASSKAPVGVITNRRPIISAIISDSGGSGINSSSIVLYLDESIVVHSYNSESGNVSYIPSTDLNLTSHTVRLIAFDNAGNILNTSWTFNISSVGVGFASLRPENNSIVDKSDVEISVTLQDIGGGINSSTIIMRLDDDSVDFDYSNNTKKVTYEGHLEDGNHTVTVSAADNNGVRSSISWSFIVDTKPPSVRLFVPGNGSVVSRVYEISAVVEDDGSGINKNKIFMEINRVDVTRSLEFHETDGRVVFRPTGELAGGEYTVELWVQDKAENEKYVSWIFRIPSTAPSFSYVAPNDGAVIANSTPEISVVISEGSGTGINVNSIKFSLDGAVFDAVFSTTTGKLSFIPGEPLSDGRHIVHVEAKNNKNERNAINWSFSVDTTPPQPPTDLMLNKTENETRLRWTASSSPDVNKYLIYGSSIGFNSTTGRTPLAELSGNSTSYTHNQSGRFYYAIVAVDRTGNPSSPVFAGTCAAFEDGIWIDYECCTDIECAEGEYCEAAMHKCILPEKSVGIEEAEMTISLAESAIQNAQNAGKNVSKAEEFLSQARNSYNAGNYKETERLARLARDAAVNAPLLEDVTADNEEKTGGKKPLPCIPSCILPSVLALYLIKNRQIKIVKNKK